MCVSTCSVIMIEPIIRPLSLEKYVYGFRLFGDNDRTENQVSVLKI